MIDQNCPDNYRVKKFSH